MSWFFPHVAANACCFLSAKYPRRPQGLSMQLPWHGPSLEELPGVEQKGEGFDGEITLHDADIIWHGKCVAKMYKCNLFSNYMGVS